MINYTHQTNKSNAKIHLYDKYGKLITNEEKIKKSTRKVY